MTIPDSMLNRYNEYIKSPQWKQRREQALARSGYCCEKCGFSKWSKKLEVHHITYERLGNERASDLQVLCQECHKEEDAKRAAAGRVKSYNALWDARFNGWASKVYGEDWQETHNQIIDQLYQEFTDWVNRQG